MLTEEQFAYLAKKYMDMVFRLALHYTKSRSESDDITQEVLLKLYRTDKPFESEDHVRYWLIRVTVNECKRAFLSPWKRTEPIEDYAEQLAFKTPEHSELFHAVMALPQKYRVPLFLHYYEGYSCEEISQFLGIPNATVRTRLRRGGNSSKPIFRRRTTMFDENLYQETISALHASEGHTFGGNEHDAQDKKKRPPAHDGGACGGHRDPVLHGGSRSGAGTGSAFGRVL